MLTTAVTAVTGTTEQVEATQIMRIRDNIVRMYSMMTGQTQEQITIVREREGETGRQRQRESKGERERGQICVGWLMEVC